MGGAAGAHAVTSANVETAARIDDQARKKQLMDIILADVDRLDRLITDISSASRLDAELSRAEMERVDRYFDEYEEVRAAKDVLWALINTKEFLFNH